MFDIRIRRISKLNTFVACSIGLGSSYYIYKPYVDEQSRKREEKRAARRALAEAAAIVPDSEPIPGPESQLNTP